MHGKHCINMGINIGIFLYILSLCIAHLLIKQIMKIIKRNFEIGHCVYAKMKFYPPWPALILDIKGFSARVQFFGWRNEWYFISV